MSFPFSPVEPLSSTHVVTGFDCGSPAQSVWLAEHALQAHRAGLSRVYVVADTYHQDRRVIGYYALAAGSVAPVDASPRLRQGAGQYHQPVVILTRLGLVTERQMAESLAAFHGLPLARPEDYPRQPVRAGDHAIAAV